MRRALRPLPQCGQINIKTFTDATLHIFDFRRALVLDPETSELATLELPSIEEAEREISMHFVSNALDMPTDLIVETLYRGREADWMRAFLRQDPHASVAQVFRDYYANTYPSIVMASKLRVEDDPRRNLIEVIESYEIPEFWQASETQ